jgi:hypothetical protein
MIVGDGMNQSPHSSNEFRSTTTLATPPIRGPRRAASHDPAALPVWSYGSPDDTRTVAQSLEVGGEVSPRDVRTAVTRHARPERQRVEAAIRRVLDTGNVSFLRDWPVTIESAGSVDFWIPADGPDLAGCAVLVVDSVGNDEVAQLTAVAEALDRSAVRYRALVVIVDGEIAATHGAQLRHVFGREPLPVAGDSFEADFAAAVKAMLYRFDTASSAGSIARLPDQLDRLDRQQSRTQDMLAHVNASLGELKTAFTTAQRPAGLDPVGGRTPEQIRVLFDTALTELDQLASTAVTVGPVFDMSAAEPSSLTPLRQLGNAPDEPLGGLGAAALVRALVVGFRHAVEDWFTAMPSSTGLDEAGRRRLRDLCGRYDKAYGCLPVREMYGLRRLPQGRPSDSPPWNERMSRTLVAVEHLGSDVREIALRLLAD